MAHGLGTRARWELSRHGPGTNNKSHVRSSWRASVRGGMVWFRARRLSAPPVDRMLATHGCAATDNRSPPIYHQPTPGAVLRVTEGRPIGRARAFPRGRPAGRCCVGQRRRRPVDGGGRRRPPAAAMVGTIHARHAVLSAPVCCPNCPSARAIRGGHLRGKRRHCDPRPRPPRESAYRAGAFQTGRGVCKCPPAQARVFARLSGSARPRAGACREAHLR